MHQKFTNKKFLYGVGIVAILLLGFVLFRIVSSSGQVEEAVPTPTPTPRYQKVDDGVDAEISVRAGGKYADLTIIGLDGKYVKLEYEVTYNTDKTPKGTIGKETLSKGQDEVEIEVELGSCSTGGTCTYYTGVKDFGVIVKFYDEDKEVFVFEKEFDEE